MSGKTSERRYPETVRNRREATIRLLGWLLDNGANEDDIIAGAAAYARQVERTGERPVPMADWLRARGWEQHRH
jgi:hypothetical protein